MIKYLQSKIGEKVVNKKGEVGTIESVDVNGGYIKTIFNGESKEFTQAAFNNGLLKFVDPSFQKVIDDIIEEKRKVEVAAKAARMAAEQKRNEAKTEAKNRLIAGEDDASVAAATGLLVQEVASIRRTLPRQVTPTTTHVAAVEISGKLKYDGKPLGTVAKEVYHECVKGVGFNPAYEGSFGGQQDLYHKDAAKPGLDVWMLAHSNWTETKNGKWSNRIYGKDDYIDETYDDGLYYDIDNNRVVFAKNKKGVYIFLGVYEVVGRKENVKTYHRISKEY